MQIQNYEKLEALWLDGREVTYGLRQYVKRAAAKKKTSSS